MARTIPIEASIKTRSHDRRAARVSAECHGEGGSIVACMVGGQPLVERLCVDSEFLARKCLAPRGSLEGPRCVAALELPNRHDVVAEVELAVTPRRGERAREVGRCRFRCSAEE